MRIIQSALNAKNPKILNQIVELGLTSFNTFMHHNSKFSLEFILLRCNNYACVSSMQVNSH